MYYLRKILDINKQNTRLHCSDESNQSLGSRAEEAVSNHLKNEGYRILDRNFRKRTGEIDIIAQKNEIIAFIEVKFRTSDYFNLSEVITYSKQRKIISAAYSYIAHHQFIDKVFRFDVALVHYINNAYTINYIRNAFCP